MAHALMLLLVPEMVVERRAVAAGALSPLARSLAADLVPLLEHDVHIPPTKARLTRAGGRCPSDGTTLDFDPFSPHAHRCPRCGRVFRGQAHDETWVSSYQLWLAERAVHASLLHLLEGDARHAELTETILGAYTDAYLRYPNRDNALGPTRPFFSTYLESIWLLQICVATDLMEMADRSTSLGAAVRDRIVEPSRALIRSFDEGMSNRQTWHAAALLAAARLLDDSPAADDALHGPSGVTAHLRDALLADGTWYEGENYHLFAHRALWYGVSMAEIAGYEFAADLRWRYEEGFATPFVTALPDFTFPARRDSQYAVSLRQWRFAELAELGLVRRDDPRLVSALTTLYTDDVPRRDTGRATSTAETERNMPASALTRLDLGWRSLLSARPELPPLRGTSPRSALLDGQGLVVLRRDAGAIYVGLDYGHSGGGHGHPDRLNLLLYDGRTRWLDDMGTGSYLDPSLHWYRSTLAHNAPLVGGLSQCRVSGWLAAYDEWGVAGWMSARTSRIGDDADVGRTIVVVGDYVIDILEWAAPAPVVVDLPMHVEPDHVSGIGPWTSKSAGGGDGFEDGFRFLRDTAVALASGERPLTVRHHADGRELHGWISAPPAAELWRATAPGPPGCDSRSFLIVRARGSSGAVTTLWSLRQSVRSVALIEREVAVRLTDGSTHVHRPTNTGWQVEILVGRARSTIDLAGLRQPAVSHQVPHAVATPKAVELRRGAPLTYQLGEAHYRRSEESWVEAGRPTATVRIDADGDELSVSVDVAKPTPAFSPRRPESHLDNEHPDTNSDGVQLHLLLPGRYGASLCSWIFVPEHDAVRVTETGPVRGAVPVRASWSATGRGYQLRVDAPVPEKLRSADGLFALDVLVNETAPDRERRRGQLVLSGGAGEYVYLRGDRQPTDRFLWFRLPHA